MDKNNLLFAYENGYWLRIDNTRNPTIRININDGICTYNKIEHKLPTFWQGILCENDGPKRILQSLANPPYVDNPLYKVTLYHNNQQIDKINKNDNFIILTNDMEKKISSCFMALIFDTTTSKYTLYAFMYPKKILGKKENIYDDDLFESQNLFCLLE